MTNAALYRLLDHEALPAPLAAALRDELDHGAANDTRLLLAAALEGLCAETVAGFHRLLVLDPVPAARSLCRMEITGRRLWTDAQKAASYAAFDATDALATLLDYWVRARAAYRGRELAEKLTPVRYADGRAFTPADLTQLQKAPEPCNS